MVGMSLLDIDAQGETLLLNESLVGAYIVVQYSPSRPSSAMARPSDRKEAAVHMRLYCTARAACCTGLQTCSRSEERPQMTAWNMV